MKIQLLKLTFLFLFIYTNKASGQKTSTPVIMESAIVKIAPNNSQGYLVMHQTPGVSYWKVTVLGQDLDARITTTVEVRQYTSEIGLNYVHIEPQYFVKNNYSFRISGYDENAGHIITEDHDVQAIGDGEQFTPKCRKKCIGSDYAWEIRIWSDPLSANGEILELHETWNVLPTGTTAGIPYYENVSAIPYAALELKVQERNMIIASPWLGVDIIGPLTPGYDPVTGNYQPVYDASGMPLTMGEPYYKIKKDMGEWREVTPQTDVVSTNATYCASSLNFLIDVMNNNSASAPDLSDPPLSCDASGILGPYYSLPSSPFGDNSYLDCLMSQMITYFDQVDEFWLLSTLSDWQNAVADCENIIGWSGDPVDPLVTPGVIEQIRITPVDGLNNGSGEPLVFEKGKNENLAPLHSLAQGLYVFGILFSDGFYYHMYFEMPNNNNNNNNNNNPVNTDLEFAISPNPVQRNEQFTINLNSEIEGDANIEIISVQTGSNLLSGTISNDMPFTGFLNFTGNGAKPCKIRIYTDTRSGSKNLIIR